jgi:hypothetical protein
MPRMQMYSYLGFRIGIIFADKLLPLLGKQDKADFVLVPPYHITSIDTDDSGLSTSRKRDPQLPQFSP